MRRAAFALLFNGLKGGLRTGCSKNGRKFGPKIVKTSNKTVCIKYYKNWYSVSETLFLLGLYTKIQDLFSEPRAGSLIWKWYYQYWLTYLTQGNPILIKHLLGIIINLLFNSRRQSDSYRFLYHFNQRKQRPYGFCDTLCVWRFQTFFSSPKCQN